MLKQKNKKNKTKPTKKCITTTILTAVIAISVVSRSALTMEMSFFYCVLSSSGLHHPIDDGCQAADLTGLPAQVVHHSTFLAYYEVRFHLSFALDCDWASEFHLVTPVHQDLRKSLQTGWVNNLSRADDDGNKNNEKYGVWVNCFDWKSEIKKWKKKWKFIISKKSLEKENKPWAIE